VAWYSGDALDAMAAPLHPNYLANGMMFSTPDSDNDYYTGGNCASVYGWWMRRCSTSAIMGDTFGIWTTGSPTWNVQASRMLVKLN